MKLKKNYQKNKRMEALMLKIGYNNLIMIIKVNNYIFQNKFLKNNEKITYKTQIPNKFKINNKISEKLVEINFYNNL